MANMIYEILRVVLMVAVFCAFRYLIPWAREKLGNERFQRISAEVRKYVLAAQQMYPDKTGAERREIVTEKIREFLIQKNISLTDEQIRDFLEAAVKAMKMAKE